MPTVPISAPACPGASVAPGGRPGLIRVRVRVTVRVRVRVRARARVRARVLL